MRKTLNTIPMLEEWRVTEIYGDINIRRRLLDLGFIPGASVKKVLISPFKNPKAYQINGNILVLRDSDAKEIIVEEKFA